MTDIVERLRDPAYPPPPAGDTLLRFSAADEIERLRAELVAANVRAGKYSAGCEQCEPLRAENDMLRSLIIDAPTKEERDELFERRFGRAVELAIKDRADGQEALK